MLRRFLRNSALGRIVMIPFRFVLIALPQLGRQFGPGVWIVRHEAELGTLPRRVIVHLGTNGTIGISYRHDVGVKYSNSLHMTYHGNPSLPGAVWHGVGSSPGTITRKPAKPRSRGRRAAGWSRSGR